MHRVVIAAGILAVWLSGSASAWAQDCDPLRPSRTIDTEVRNATEANANILLRSLGQGNIRNDYRRIEQNQSFSNPDDANRWSSFIYMLCTLLQRSSFSDSDKLVQYFKLVELSQQSPPTEPSISQAPASATPAPAPTPPREQDGVLYETGVGEGGFEAWSLTPGWRRLNGMLLNDGTRGNKEFSPSIAPYRPASADYAVEAEIRVIDDGDRYDNNSFGVVVRVHDQEGYAVGVASSGATRVCYLSAWVGVGFVGGGSGITDNSRCRPVGQSFKPGEDWHTYRIEVKANTIKLLIDEAVVANVSDNMFISGGGAGLWSSGYQLEVRNFKVIQL